MKLEEILGVEEKEMKELVKKIPTLKIKKIIEYRYGLKDGRYKSLEEVAKEFKITLELAREYESRGVRLLKCNAPKKTLFQKIKLIFKSK